MLTPSFLQPERPRREPQPWGLRRPAGRRNGCHGAGSRVEGGILVEKPSGWFNSSSKPPRVVIGPNAVVQGTLDFRRDVELLVSESATVGTIKGATATRFSGATP